MASSVLGVLTLSTMAFGKPTSTPWRASPGLLSPEIEQLLIERYPAIRSPDDLEDLLEEAGRHQPLARLEAQFVQGSWLLVGARALPLADIDIDTVTQFFRTPLTAGVQTYLGQIDSPELRARIKDVVEAYLKRRGYPKALVSLEIDSREDQVSYTVHVNEGQPCVIDRVVSDFKFPLGTSFAVKVGDLCDREAIDAGMTELESALRAKGYNQLRLELKEIAYHPEINTATISITGVLGQKVHYEIIDQQKRFLIDDLFADGELTKVDPTLISPDSMAAELVRRYRNRGFLDAQVKGPEIKHGKDDEFTYVFRIDAGTQYLLRGVSFEGNTVFTEQELLDTMDLEGFLQRAPPFDPEAIQTGITAIRGRYQQKGYWDSKVRDPGTGQKDKDTSSVRLSIEIEEGSQHTLADVLISGNVAVPTDEIRAMLMDEAGKQLKSGMPLDRSQLVDFQQKIRTAYLNQGYLSADVAIELKSVQQRRQIPTTLVVTVKEGPRVRIGDITVIGLVNTHPKVVRRELLFKSGDWYDPEKIAQARQALTRLGLFRSVQIVPAERTQISDKVAQLDMIVDVRESKAGNVTFGPGWSLGKGWNYETEAAYSNIGGVGRQVSLRGAISEETNQKAISRKTLVGRRIGAGYIEPWIFDLPLDLSIGANQKAEWGGELWELSYGGEIALIHKFRNLLPGSSISTFYGQKIASTEGPTRLQDALIANDVRIGQMGLRYNIDRRNDLRFPSSGYTLDSELAWARYEFGGDLRYFRWEVGHSMYFGILSDLVFAVNTGLASYEGIERKGQTADILPPSERLFAGGSESIRGYRTRSLGPVVRTPKIDVDPQSGRCNFSGYDFRQLDGVRRTTLKTELRYRLNDSFALTSFVDSGNVFLTKQQMRGFQEQYKTPVQIDGCPELSAYRSVEDNVGYDYADILSNPGYLWSRHYYSYGLAGNLLTAIGSVNLGYGLPWKEPQTEQCSGDPNYCLKRGKQTGYWLARGEFYLNVGARF